LRNKCRFQNGKGIRYKVSSSFSGSGLATFSLPTALPGKPTGLPTPAPEPSPAPTLAPTLVPTDGSCSTGAYENCLTSKCCQDLGFLCYEKDQHYAQCRPECQPGVNPDDPPRYRTPWSCNILGAPAPVPTPAPAPAPTSAPVPTPVPQPSPAPSSTLAPTLSQQMVAARQERMRIASP